MADYYAVLKRTLSGFGEPSQSLRAKIYDKARVTIARQLDATQPPLPDETKAAQLAQLDEAIVRMEAEYAGPPADDFVGDPPPLPIGGMTGVAPVEEPELEQGAEPEPIGPAEPASAEPVPTDLVAPPPVVMEPAAAPPVQPTEDLPAPVEPAFVQETPSEPSATEAETPVVDEATATPADDTDPLAGAFAAIEAARAGGLPHVAPVEPGSETDDAIAFDDDDFAAAAAREGTSDAEPVAVSVDDAPSTRESVAAPFALEGGAPESDPTDTNSSFDDRGVAERDAAALAAAPVAVPRRKSGGRGVMVFLLLIAAIGLLFLFRAPLLSAVGVPTASVDRLISGVPGIGPYLVGEVDDPDDPTRPKPVPTIRITPQPEPVEPDEAGKREQRLGADGQEVDPAAGREEVGTLPPPTVPSPNIPAPTVPEPPAIDGDPAAEPETETVTRTVPIEPVEPDEPAEVAVNEAPTPATPAVEEPAAQTQPAAPVVAQSAVLYEEGSGTRATRSDRGAVVWSVVRESPGNGEPEEPAIRAELDVPERDLKATITLRRNSDRALAASHLMEVNFQPAPGFSGQNIDEVLSVRMKADEQAQGSPLSVIPAKIAPGYFYIALDNLPSARARNVELLRGSRYIDIPVEYVTGRRALVSLEKGVVGQRVFAEAFEAWDAKPE